MTKYHYDLKFNKGYSLTRSLYPIFNELVKYMTDNIARGRIKLDEVIGSRLHTDYYVKDSENTIALNLYLAKDHKIVLQVMHVLDLAKPYENYSIKSSRSYQEIDSNPVNFWFGLLRDFNSEYYKTIDKTDMLDYCGDRYDEICEMIMLHALANWDRDQSKIPFDSALATSLNTYQPRLDKYINYLINCHKKYVKRFPKDVSWAIKNGFMLTAKHQEKATEDCTNYVLTDGKHDIIIQYHDDIESLIFNFKKESNTKAHDMIRQAIKNIRDLD